MPSPVRDNYSGAIIFHPTPEEMEIGLLKEELISMKGELADKLAQLDEVLKLASTKE